MYGCDREDVKIQISCGLQRFCTMGKGIREHVMINNVYIQKFFVWRLACNFLSPSHGCSEAESRDLIALDVLQTYVARLLLGATAGGRRCVAFRVSWRPQSLCFTVSW